MNCTVSDIAEKEGAWIRELVRSEAGLCGVWEVVVGEKEIIPAGQPWRAISRADAPPAIETAKISEARGQRQK